MLVLCISNGSFLLKTTLMELVRFEKKAEKNMKCRRIPALLGFLMILSGYGLAPDIFPLAFYRLLSSGPADSITHCDCTVFYPYTMKMSKQNKRAFYSETKIITTPVFIAIALTTFIYLIYYFLTVHTCCKMVFKVQDAKRS